MEIRNVSNMDTNTLSQTKNTVSEKVKENVTENVETKQKDSETGEMNSKVEKNENDTVKVISRDGDTLEITRISDATLTKYPKSKLKVLLQDGKISKQQYEKAIRSQSNPI